MIDAFNNLNKISIVKASFWMHQCETSQENHNASKKQSFLSIPSKHLAKILEEKTYFQSWSDELLKTLKHYRRESEIQGMKTSELVTTHRFFNS